MRLAFLSTVALAIAACDVVVPASPARSDDRITAEDRACQEDAECVAVDAGCCPCTSNGARTAIHADALTTVLERRAACDELCSDQLSTDATCATERVACVDGRCELVATSP